MAGGLGSEVGLRGRGGGWNRHWLCTYKGAHICLTLVDLNLSDPPRGDWCRMPWTPGALLGSTHQAVPSLLPEQPVWEDPASKRAGRAEGGHTASVRRGGRVISEGESRAKIRTAATGFRRNAREQGDAATGQDPLRQPGPGAGHPERSEQKHTAQR